MIFSSFSFIFIGKGEVGADLGRKTERETDQGTEKIERRNTEIDRTVEVGVEKGTEVEAGIKKTGIRTEIDMRRRTDIKIETDMISTRIEEIERGKRNGTRILIRKTEGEMIEKSCLWSQLLAKYVKNCCFFVFDRKNAPHVKF